MKNKSPRLFILFIIGGCANGCRSVISNPAACLREAMAAGHVMCLLTLRMVRGWWQRGSRGVVCRSRVNTVGSVCGPPPFTLPALADSGLVAFSFPVAFPDGLSGFTVLMRAFIRSCHFFHLQVSGGSRYYLRVSETRTGRLRKQRRLSE